MPANYNQISSSGSIISAPNPVAFDAKKIREIIYEALNSKDFEFTWIQKRSQPYHGTFFDGENTIDLYIYAWNMTPAYRTNPSEKRIQIPAAVNSAGIDREITDTEKSIILGIYNTATGTPLLAAWDTKTNRGHGQKSCYVQIEDVARAITENIVSVTDRNGSPIYTMTPDFLGDYVSLLKENNALGLSRSNRTLKEKVTSAGKEKRKKRTIRSVEKLHEIIESLPETEQNAIQKIRIGQGYFRDLLINKYSCKCVLCEIDTENLLIASHIKEWSDCTDAEKLDENNGLLLCAHHDALFDKHLISFDDEGKLIVSTTLSEDEKIKLRIPTIPSITVTSKMKNYLAVHRSKLK